MEPNKTLVPESKTIQRWPGPSNNHLSDKVPTELIYTDRDEKSVDAWGSHCNKRLQGLVARSFKLNIASNTSNGPEHGHDISLARQYFRDYITEVCAYIEGCLKKRIPHYKSNRVEFVFSIPTTWDFDTEALREIESILRGNVGVSRDRKAGLGLTKAAAAVDIGRKKLEKGHVFHICDVSNP